MNREVLIAAKSEGKADLIVENGRIVNVNTREIYEGGVACFGKHIIAVGDVDYTRGEQTNTIDAEGKFIVPGFIEGHIHPESSNLSPRRFAQVVLVHGTTSTFSDFHEIAIVRGLDGVLAALDEVKDTYLNFFWIVPSHVPFSPDLETSGGYFNAEIIVPALAREEAWGLSEVVSNYVLEQHPDLMKSIAAANKIRKSQVGHGPMTKGTDWNAFASVGIANDHEAIDEEDVLLRARNGIYTHLRHSLICPTLPDLLKTVEKYNLDRCMFSLVTDDTNVIVLTEEGHIDYLARMAMRNGVDFITAMQMVTINPAQSYHAERLVGNLAPGRLADILILSDDSPDFQVDKTIAKGELVAENGRYLKEIHDEEHDPIMFNTFNIKGEITGPDLTISSNNGAVRAKVHVMKCLRLTPYVTEGMEATLSVKDGAIQCDIDQDILHIAVVERHQATGNIGKGFVGGFGMKTGALASSMAHDNHNIAVVGSDPDDMAVAVKRVAEMDGGVCVVEDGESIEEIAMPLFGLLSDLDPWELAGKKKRLLQACTDRGCTLSEAHLFLSFLTLVPIPAYKITDKGYVDAIKWEIMDPVLAWE